MMKMFKNKEESLVDSDLFQVTRRQLIPNYLNLDSQVKKELDSILETILVSEQNCKQAKPIKTKKQQIQQISKMSILQEAPLLRSHIWKLLLDTLDLDPTTWHSTRLKNKELYTALKKKFLNSYIDEEDLLGLGVNDIEKQLWDEIALDTKRTHSCLNFFQAELSSSFFRKVYASKPTRHCDMINRILYIWGKTNSTVRYVQGMNEILAPLYYLEFQALEELYWDRESQVFFMFSAVMSFVIDMHIKEMDDCESGIMGRIIALNHFLRVADGQLWQRMQEEGIYPQYYSFRWLALLLAQQFDLYDTMRLWDKILAYEGYKRFFYVYCLCIAILKIRKRQIMQNDYVTSLPLIQKLKDVSIDKLMGLGNELYEKYKQTNIEKQYQRMMSQEEMNKSQKKMREQSQSEGKRQWSYSDLLKSTGNYLSKWKSWGKKQ